MKDSARIVQYIDQCIEHFLDAPGFYALDAQMLEEKLFQLDMLRQFILEDGLCEGDVLSASTYGEFLRRRGYGAMMVTTEPPVRAWDYRNDTKLAKLRREWAAYLKHRGEYARPFPPPHDPFYFPINLVEPLQVQ